MNELNRNSQSVTNGYMFWFSVSSFSFASSHSSDYDTYAECPWSVSTVCVSAIPLQRLKKKVFNVSVHAPRTKGVVQSKKVGECETREKRIVMLCRF